MKMNVLGLLLLSCGFFSGCTTLRKGVAYYQAEWAKGETDFQRTAHNASRSPRVGQDVWINYAYSGTRGAPPSIYDPR